MPVRRVFLAVTIAVAAACSDGTPMPAPSDPQPPPAPPPPVVNNAPPTITEIRTSAPRVDADAEIEVTAFVKDDETPIDQLTYAWSASPAAGTFAGTGPTVRWRAPAGQRTPDTYTLTLTVTERYTSAGEPQQNTLSSSATVRYNDSVAEIDAIAVQFYKDFGTVSVSASECVRNFSDTCRGKEVERAQIQANRDRRTAEIIGSTLNFTPTISVDGIDGASFLQSCTFEDLKKNGGHERVTGDCALTAVYENWRWWLCDSLFNNGRSTNTGLLKYMVPGRVVQRWP